MLNRFLVLLAFLMIAQGCKDEGINPIDQNYVIPESEISYYEHLQPMFNGKCGFGSSCHSVENLENGLFFADKSIFMDYRVSTTGEKLVDMTIHKESPWLSPLYLIITEGYGPIDRMPPLAYGREWLNRNQTDGVKQWILEGAND